MEASSAQQLAREGPSTIQHPVWSIMYVLSEWSGEHEEHESYLGGSHLIVRDGEDDDG